MIGITHPHKYQTFIRTTHTSTSPPFSEKMSNEINPVGRLQELAVKKGWALPVYDYTGISQTEFRCVVMLNGLMGEAVASRKQFAKNLAASSLLHQIDAPQLVSRLAVPSTRQSATHPEVSPVRQESITPKPFITVAHAQPSVKILDHCNKNMKALSDIGNGSASHSRSNNDLIGEAMASCTQYDKNKPIVRPLLKSEMSLQQLNSTMRHYDPPHTMKVSSVRQDSQKQFADVQPLFKALDDFIQQNSTAQSNIENGTGFLSHADNMGEISDSDESVSSSISDTKNRSAYQTVSKCDGFSPVSFLHTVLSKLNQKPSFELVHTANSGTNNPVFSYKVSALGKVGQGKGCSKKEAKANAASSLLEILYGDSVDGQIKSDVTVKDNHVGQLMDFCISNFVKAAPHYELIQEEGAAHSKVFTMSCSVGQYQAQSSAKTKQAAKNMCAKALLEKLRSQHKEAPLENISFVSALENEDINEKAWKRLAETNVRTKLKLNEAPSMIPLQDYPYLFENDYYGKSETLHKFKRENPTCDIKTIPNPQQLCEKILSELSMKYDVEILQSTCGCTVNLYTSTQPRWSFLKSAPTQEMAIQQLYIQILDFLFKM